MRESIAALCVLAATIGLSACGGDNGGDAAPESVSFASPPDGATVVSPFEACLEAEGVEIEAAGEVHEGHGHFHVIVDPSPEEEAQYTGGEEMTVPKDATHIHLGEGQMCTNIEAGPGEHALLAVVAGGDHVTLNPPVVDEIRVTVSQPAP